MLLLIQNRNGPRPVRFLGVGWLSRFHVSKLANFPDSRWPLVHRDRSQIQMSAGAPCTHLLPRRAMSKRGAQPSVGDISGLNAAEIKPGLRTRALMPERTSVRVSNLGDVAFELVSARVSILVMIQCPLELEYCRESILKLGISLSIDLRADISSIIVKH